MPALDELHDSLRLAKDAFLAGAPIPKGMLRDDILKSWRRATLVGVAPNRTTLPHWPDFDHSRLSEAALPVLESFSDQIDTTKTCLVLADARSRIIRRWVGDAGLNAALDRSEAVPGVSLAEDYCGTNGIGSAVEERRVVSIRGGEHWADRFLEFTCVGAPLIHPVSRQVEGVVTLACRYEDTNRLMAPLVQVITKAIQDRLAEAGSLRERRLLEVFLDVSRRRAQAPVIVLNDRLIMTNAAAAGMLDRDDHPVLWQQALDAVRLRETRSADLVLASGVEVESTCSAVREGDQLIGVVIHLCRHETETTPPGRAPRGSAVEAARDALGELVGRSRSWCHVVEEARRHRNTNASVLVAGERGVGKLTLAKAAFAPGGEREASVLDAALQPVQGSGAWMEALAERLAAAPGALIVRHVELLDQAAVQATCALIDRVKPGSLRLVATMTVDMAGRATVPPELTERFGGLRIDIPPLRNRPEDITELADAVLRRHGRPGQRWTSEVLHALLRADWPGNVRELETVLQGTLGRRRCGDVTIDDLPWEARAKPASALSRLDRMERNEIIVALEQCGGNKSDAAAMLGISRSTIYRKIKAFGLDGHIGGFEPDAVAR